MASNCCDRALARSAAGAAVLGGIAVVLLRIVNGLPSQWTAYRYARLRAGAPPEG